MDDHVSLGAHEAGEDAGEVEVRAVSRDGKAAGDAVVLELIVGDLPPSVRQLAGGHGVDDGVVDDLQPVAVRVLLEELV